MTEQSIYSLALDITNSLKAKGKILIYGNGGCASIADHFVTELVGRFKEERSPLSAISLNANCSLITCIANDFGFERIFSRQIDALASDVDVVIGLSTSGKSKNIIEALYSSYRKKCSTWLISGSKVPSEIYELCDKVLLIPSNDTAEIQNMMLTIIHKISQHIDNEFCKDFGTTAFDRALSINKEYNTLLLDRDGVINKLIANGYVEKSEEFQLTDEFSHVASSLSKRFSNIIVVTNQKCVSKGIINEEELSSVHDKMIDEIQKIGGRIDAIFSAISKDRNEYKPNIGMMNRITRQFPNVDFSKSVMIGDSYSDFLFAKRIGATYIPI